MSCLSNILQVCPNAQAFLNEHFSQCNKGMVREEMPFAEFLGSEANNMGLDRRIHPGNGKTRKVDLLYTKRILESDKKTDQSNPRCVATKKYGQCAETYEIDPDDNISFDELINIADLTEACQDNGQYFMERLAHLVDVTERAVATDITDRAILLTGKWAADAGANGSNELVVKTLKDGTSQELDPFTMENIEEGMRRTGYCAPAGIFGGDLLSKYAKRIRAGCCAQQGIDLSKIWNEYGMSVSYDRRVKNALGSNNLSVVLQLGAVALLWYVRSGWKNGVASQFYDGSSYVHGFVTSPRLGIPMDVVFKDDCGAISIIVTATVKPVAMPNDMFEAGDEFNGVKWYNKIRVTNV